MGKLKQPSGKIVRAYAVEGDLDAALIKSNTFPLEWPPHSSIFQEFPEIDRGQWFVLEEAKIKIAKGQSAFLDRLAQELGNS